MSLSNEVVVTSGASQSSVALVDNWTKNVITQYKTTSATEKGELQRLNKELKNYLENVRILEALNKRLIDDVDKARTRALPSIMDKTDYDKRLEDVRLRLENESVDAVRYQVQIEENSSENQHLSERIRFFAQESELQRQKIQSLQNQLAEIVSQKDSLLRSAKLANDDILREQEHAAQAEATLAKLRKQLSDSRLKYKKIEFETQSFQDEIEFRKAIFNEEITDLRTRYNSLGNVIPGVDINEFYKKELHNAVRQIKEDFHTLNEQQLKDYKLNKENELAMKTAEFENERKVAELARAKLQASADVEIQSTADLKAGLSQNKTELDQLNARHVELLNKLAHLEEKARDSREKKFFILERYQNEIDSLKDQNEQYAHELTYWEKVTRSKLESEIQTYRSILNTQLRLMQIDASLPSSGSFSSSTVIDSNKNKISGGGSSGSASQTIINSGSGSSFYRRESQTDASKADALRILREVFDHFDKDRSGRINSFEFDNILQKLNIQLSLSSYNQLMKEFDKDGSRDLDFEEFCNIMLPVFTGSFDDRELLYAFKKFDTDNSGLITVDELKQILSKVGQYYSESQIASLIASVDKDKDGKLSFQEFTRLIKSPAL